MKMAYNAIRNILLKVLILNVILKNYNFITLWIFHIYVDCRYNFFSFGKVITNYRADFALKLKGKVWLIDGKGGKTSESVPIIVITS